MAMRRFPDLPFPRVFHGLRFRGGEETGMGSRTRSRGDRALWAATCALALVLAGCGGSDEGDGGGQPTKGGTLELLGAGDVDHLDPASAYYTASYALERAFTRQLVTYPASKNVEKATTVVADVAKVVPSTENGGISADGLTYTFHLRDGVMWDTTPPREVAAEDFVRGVKRICNPASLSGGLSYYTATIKGFADFCDGFAKVDGSDPKAMADYMNNNDIEGLQAPDDKTVVVTLTQPASDFLDIIALPFASPAPVEYDKYVPDGKEFRQNTISSGPYSITTYKPGQEYVLERNPAWTKSSDPVRDQHVDAIHIRSGQTSETAVQQQLEAGTADLVWDLPIPTADLARLNAESDPNLGVYPSPTTNPYISINTLSPNNDGALGKVPVRQALQYAIDKTAVGRVYGGPDFNTPLDQVIPPGQVGYEKFNLYPTPGHKGDPARCRQLLADAGYPNGLDLKFVVRNEGNHPAVGQTVKADLEACGVRTEIISVSLNDFYAKYLNDPAATESGTWDIAEPGWVGDWYGNNGRTMLAVLFDGRTFGPNTVNYGGYNSPKVNALIDKALAAKTESEAADYWSQADRQIMQDAAFIPLQTQGNPHYHSDRVQNAIYSTFADQFDFTVLWLNPAN